MKNIKFKENVLQLNLQDVSTGLEYDIAYKTVGNTPFFKDEAVRNTLLELLDEQAVKNQVRIEQARIYADGLSFHVIVNRKLDIQNFLTFTAQYLINQLNKRYPELNLKATAPGGALSRLWHRPYYLKTTTPVKYRSIADYLA